ncbi:BRCT domain-containing protein [Gigaspora margarita]|uniref:BRCT domain-containing protein n=2 Tax=Gigaspora margarita TaxID=4874 RepID=A0A8H3X0H5_GIGMA|nr:BRCT domain-containing protein [Gigaspora margarita]
MATSTSVQFTVGKLDAGMAILLTEDHHLIEFPSLLLPPGVTSGSIVNIGVNRNYDQEARQRNEFWELQEAILEEFGRKAPEPPKLHVKHITQTSVILEWEPLVLCTATFKSLEIFRNGTRVSQQTSLGPNNSVKLSGLQLDTEYEFHITIKTTAGSFTSNKIKIRTHDLENLTGINVCFGYFSDDATPNKQELKEVLKRIGARYSDHVGNDTTHLLCNEKGGANYQKALDNSIPIVKPEWLIACENAGKMQAALPYYLVAQPEEK